MCAESKTKACSRCGGLFTCGPEEKGGHCWCSRMPTLMPLDFSRDCQCPTCLAASLTERIEELSREKTVVELVRLAAPYRGGELIPGLDYTIEEGLMVFSRWYHLKRGTCCGNDCRNCPYEKG